MLSPSLHDDVRKLLENDCSGHDYFHILRVISIAQTIAKHENADGELVEIIALLHDADDGKLFDDNSRNAEKILEKHGYPRHIREKILSDISRISFKGSGLSVPDSLEGRIVQDADRLDAMGAVGIARAFTYGGSNGRKIHDPEIPPADSLSEIEYRTLHSTTINHFHEKLLLLKDLMNTESAKVIAENRHNFMLRFLDEFFGEWNGKC